jgi:hypothetical protein
MSDKKTTTKTKSLIKIGTAVKIVIVGMAVALAIASLVSQKIATPVLSLSLSMPDGKSVVLQPGSNDNKLLAITGTAINSSQVSVSPLTLIVTGDDNYPATFLDNLQNVRLVDAQGTILSNAEWNVDYANKKGLLAFPMKQSGLFFSTTPKTIYLMANVSKDAYKGVIKKIEIQTSYNGILAADNKDQEIGVSVAPVSGAFIWEINGAEGTPIIMIENPEVDSNGNKAGLVDGRQAKISWGSLNAKGSQRVRLILEAYDNNAVKNMINSYEIIPSISTDGSLIWTARVSDGAFNYKIKAELYEQSNPNVVLAQSETMYFPINYDNNGGYSVGDQVIPKKPIVSFDTSTNQTIKKGDSYKATWTTKDLISGYNEVFLKLKSLANKQNSSDIILGTALAFANSFPISTTGIPEGCYTTILEYKVDYGIVASRDESSPFCIQSGAVTANTYRDLIVSRGTLSFDKQQSLQGSDSGSNYSFGFAALNKDITIKSITIQPTATGTTHTWNATYLSKKTVIRDLGGKLIKENGKLAYPVILKLNKDITLNSLRTADLSGLNLNIKKGGYMNLFIGAWIGSTYIKNKEAKDKVDFTFAITNIEAVDNSGQQVTISELPLWQASHVVDKKKLATIKAKKK